MDADLKAAGERHDDEHLCTGRFGGPDTDTIYEGDCDAARFRDALAAAEDEQGRWEREAQHQYELRKAAEADADALAEALRRLADMYPESYHAEEARQKYAAHDARRQK